MESKGTLTALEFVGDWETAFAEALETGYAAVQSKLRVHGVYWGHRKDWEGSVIETSPLREMMFDGKTLQLVTLHHMYEVAASDDGFQHYKEEVEKYSTKPLP